MKINVSYLKDVLKLIKKSVKDYPLFKIPPVIIMILLRYAFSNLVYLFMRKRKNKKPILAFTNLYYNGNPRAVFEYLQNHKEKYEIFWVARNIKSLKDVRKMGGKAFLNNELEGILGLSYFLRTDIWIIAHIGSDIPLLPHKNYKVIQVKHGVGPKGSMPTKRDFDAHDAWCVPSEFIKKRHIMLWDAPPEKLYVTGFTKMDTLYKYLKKPKEKLLKEVRIKNSRKIILYAPTYDVGLWPWGNAYKEFEKLCKFCKENDLLLILRLHPYTKIKKRKIKRIIKKYENVYQLDMSIEPDTMKLLAIADILITSWSSIYTEYLLTKRPTIHLGVDEEYFTKTRGKSEVPPEYRSGEIACNNEEFYDALNIVLKEGNRFIEEQEKFLKIIHGDIDGKASERVIEVMENLLQGQKNNNN